MNKLPAECEEMRPDISYVPPHPRYLVVLFIFGRGSFIYKLKQNVNKTYFTALWQSETNDAVFIFHDTRQENKVKHKKSYVGSSSQLHQGAWFEFQPIYTSFLYTCMIEGTFQCD